MGGRSNNYICCYVKMQQLRELKSFSGVIIFKNINSYSRAKWAYAIDMFFLKKFFLAFKSVAARRRKIGKCISIVCNVSTSVQVKDFL